MLSWNPPEPTCPVGVLEHYQDLLLEHGLALGPWNRGVAKKLCLKLTEGAQEGPPYSGNLIVSTDPRVSNLVGAGFFGVRSGEILALPPEADLLAPVRDALYVEQFGDFFTTKDDPWSRLARELVPALQEKAERRWLHLGARSSLCHQGQVVASAGVFWLSGREATHAACGGPSTRIRVQVPSRKGVPGPSWVNMDFCLEHECGHVDLRLGLAQALPKPSFGRRRHEHAWRRFRLPVADLSPERRHFGFVSGRVCLGSVSVTTRSRRTKEPCLETSGVRLEALHVPNYGVPGAGHAKPETGLVTGPGHVHAWAILEGESGRSEIRCVTCDAVMARAEIQPVAQERRKAANPSILPLLGEGDETPEFLAVRDGRAS